MFQHLGRILISLFSILQFTFLLLVFARGAISTHALIGKLSFSSSNYVFVVLIYPSHSFMCCLTRSPGSVGVSTVEFPSGPTVWGRFTTCSSLFPEISRPSSLGLLWCPFPTRRAVNSISEPKIWAGYCLTIWNSLDDLWFQNLKRLMSKREMHCQCLRRWDLLLAHPPARRLVPNSISTLSTRALCSRKS